MTWRLQRVPAIGLLLFCSLNGAVAAEPTLSMSFPMGITAKKGDPITIEWKGADIPAGSSIGFFLTPERPEDAWERRVWFGPLTLLSQNIDETMQGRLNWNGRGIGCAPMDAPMLCALEGAEPGNYRFEAIIFDKRDVGLVPTRGSKPDKPYGATILAKFASPLIVIVAAP